MTLRIPETNDLDINGKLDELIEQQASDKVVNHENIPNARHFTPF